MTSIISHHCPDFIIIGAMKSATSAIYEYLMQHPLVARRMPKELHFFTLNYEKGLEWYSSQFTQGKEQKLLVGEASPGYFPSATAPNLIYQLFPDVKIILSLRNPSDRAISHYYHQLNRVKDETRDIEIAFNPQEVANINSLPHSQTSSYIQLGKYLHQLQKWLNIFPREQVLIINYHDLEIDTNAVMTQVFDFLDLPEYSLGNINKIYTNQYPKVSLDIKSRLNKYFLPYNQELNDFIGINFNLSQVAL